MTAEFFQAAPQSFVDDGGGVHRSQHLIGDFTIVAKILGDYRFALDVEDEKHALAALLEKYAPEMDFADATLVRVSELFPSFKIITDDGHFNWYRRNRDEKLPVFWIPE